MTAALAEARFASLVAALWVAFFSGLAVEEPELVGALAVLGDLLVEVLGALLVDVLGAVVVDVGFAPEVGAAGAAFEPVLVSATVVIV